MALILQQMVASGVSFGIFKNFSRSVADDAILEYDIHISPESWSLARSVLFSSGYFELTGFISHKFITHFYGWDEGLSRFIHLHIYWKVLSGESQFKNSLFLFCTRDIFDFESSGLPHLSYSIAYDLHRRRLKIKNTGLISRIRTFLDKHDYDLEEEFFKNLIFDRVSLLTDGWAMRNLSLKIFPLTVFFRIWYAFLLTLGKFRILDRRKTLAAGGLVVAIVGPDGSGKSTLISFIHDRLSFLKVYRFHYGLPSASVRLIANGFSFFRNFIKLSLPKRTDRGSPVPPSDPRTSVSVFKALYYLFLAISRYRVMAKSHRLAAKGILVVLDRAPVNSSGIDGARIPVNFRFLSKLENFFYSRIAPPDFTFRLNLYVEEVVLRNHRRDKIGKENEAEIRDRFHAFGNMRFLGKTTTLNAYDPVDVLFKKIVCHIF